MLFYWFSHLKWIQTCVKDTSNDWLDIKDLWSTQLCISLLQLDDFFFLCSDRADAALSLHK